MYKVYYFTVMINSCHRGYYAKARTLSDALKSLEHEIFNDCFYAPTLVDWRVCQTYSVMSESGKRSHRSLRRVVRGVA